MLDSLFKQKKYFLHYKLKEQAYIHCISVFTLWWKRIFINSCSCFDIMRAGARTKLPQLRYIWRRAVNTKS